MAFSQAVKIQVLVASARHCCVCHRYKGVKVEIHHIRPRKDGGPDTLDNAIALCLDCHADAGHYHAGHPRGTRLSESELRKQRDAWYETVRTKGLDPPRERERFYCRYLLCRDFDVIGQIAQGDLSRVPVERPHLAESPALSFARRLLAINRKAWRQDIVRGKCYPDQEAYLGVHGDDPTFERSDPALLPYFTSSRAPDIHELREHVFKQDPLTAFLCEQGAFPEDAARALVYEEGCGGLDLYQEVYAIRPIWLCLLAATNLARRPIAAKALEHVLVHDDVEGFRPYTQPTGGPVGLFLLPPVALPPGATLLVPLAVLLPPIGGVAIPVLHRSAIDLSEGDEIEHVRLTHTDLSQGSGRFNLIGPRLVATALECGSELGKDVQALHTLDLGNVFTLDRTWAAGSCPFVLFRSEARDFSLFAGHLFASAPNVESVERVEVPRGICTVTIAELEEETTLIRGVWRNGVKIGSPPALKKDEHFSIEVSEGDVLQIEGCYRLQSGSTRSASSPLRRNALLAEFLSTQRPRA